MFDFISPDLLLWVAIVLVLALSAVVFLQNRQLAKQARNTALYLESMDVRDDLVCRSTGDHVLTYVNDAYCRYFGKSREEFLGTRFTDHVPEDNHKSLEDQWRQFRPEASVHEFDQRVRSADGGIRWVRWLDRATFDAHGNLTEIFALGRDITDLVQAREAERAGEQLLRQIIDLVPHMIFARDADGKTLMVNQATADLYDLPMEDIVGLPMGDVHHDPDELDRFLTGDRAVIESGERMVIPEQTFNATGGEPRILQTVKIPFEAPGTGAPAILGVSVDITDQKNAESRFSEIVELAPDAVISIDKDYRIILFNRGAETIFGYDAAEIIGQPIHILLPEHLRAGHGAKIDRFKRSPENSRRMNVRGKVFGRRKDGEEFAAEASIGKLKQGGDATFIVLLRDVSEREMWEEQLRHAQKMEAVGQLTGGVAHDFNNLLTIILGNLQLLQRRIDDGPKTEHMFDRAIAAAQRGGDLTHRLLAFSRRTPLDPKLTDLGQLIDDIVKLTTRTIGENITVNVSTDDDLWRVNIDRAQLQSAIMNLAINAAHAMPGGGDLRIETSNISIDPSLALQIGELDAGDFVQVSVIDNGSGMTPETVARAFDPFFTTKDVGEGSGLGLSMVHGFVQQSGGQVRILSEAGEGTTIELYLPRAVGDGVTEEDDAPRPLIEADGNETVLVVEDDSDVRHIAVNHLAEQGYKVIEAFDGPDALQKLQDHENIDVLFTDVMLPKGISGTELASTALRLRPDLKLLFCSGNAKIDVARDFGADGDYIFLSKPYLGADLAVALRNLIDG